ncbi:hypothetical protein [Bradyrhizobium sp. Tv2a-2]|uniref:hypothetical protein n=1 Tax=Bradyrhizobium sp. Tv2a-2 TaxID=113395 RepID=UPI000418C8A9|nr:hypothetical protein [Bradyrhizobium sp. Tv2a-2]
MAELSEMQAAGIEPPAVEATGPVARTNKGILDFLCGVQRVALEEAVFATEEWLDRARTEAHLFAEFTSKMASAHSVNNVKTMFEECGQHQIDFIRRDCERIFKHSRRTVDAVSRLFDRPSED